MQPEDSSLVNNSSRETVEKDMSGQPYQVVARRYRPQNFEQLVGQGYVARALSNAIITNRVGHAYLFTGARGVGKTSTARIFAKSLNCIHGPTATPCNECEICLSISTGEDIDVLEIDGASNRGIDEIRQLRQNASIRPSRARFKIYIIDEVHMLTREAFNALLKTLEEPPVHVKFVFCTTEPSKIPITILSRCQRFDFAGITPDSIAERLSQIIRQEGATAEEGVLETLARQANGSMRDAQSLLEQLLAFAPKHIRLADVYGMLGTVDDQKIFDLLTAMQNFEPYRIFVVLNRAAAEGVDFGILTEQMMGVFRDLMAVASGCSDKELIYTSAGRYEELRTIASFMGIQRILSSLQILDQTHQRMRYSTQGRILAELALIRLCHLENLQGITQLIELMRHGKLPDIQIPVVLEQTATRNLSHSSETGRTVENHNEQQTVSGGRGSKPSGGLTEKSDSGVSQKRGTVLNTDSSVQLENKSAPSVSGTADTISAAEHQITGDSQEPIKKVKKMTGDADNSSVGNEVSPSVTAQIKLPATKDDGKPTESDGEFVTDSNSSSSLREDGTGTDSSAANDMCHAGKHEEMTDELAWEYWKKAFKNVSFSVACVTNAVVRVQFKTPSTLILFFNDDQKALLKMAEERRSELLKSLIPYFGQGLQFRFQLTGVSCARDVTIGKRSAEYRKIE